MTDLLRSAGAATLCLSVLLSACGSLSAQQVDDSVVAEDDSEGRSVRLRRLVSGLDHPWAIADLPDGGALITERPGVMWWLTSLEPSAGTLAPVAGLPDVAAVGQGGLLDVIIAPDFETSRLIYFSYSAREGRGYVTRVARGRLERSGSGDRSSARVDSIEEIFSLNRSLSGGRHFGSRLVFDREGLLYITVGERGDPPGAQDVSSHQGSVVRLNPDGTVPEDNPDIEGAARGLYTYGHRNPQGIARNPDDGTIWLHEHGPRGGDEINKLVAGSNYGWPRVTYGVAYSGREISERATAPGIRDPILHWTPSIAPSGMAFVHDSVVPEWEGDLLIGALVLEHLRRVELGVDNAVLSQERLFDGFARFRDVRQGFDGFIYILTDEDPGGLYRLEPATR